MAPHSRLIWQCMQIRLFPSTAMPLPVIGCGTWLGFDDGRDPVRIAQRDEKHDAQNGSDGRNNDSSPMYGSAEEVVGDLLSRHHERDEAFVATKVWTSGERAGIEQMQRSLRLL